MQTQTLAILNHKGGTGKTTTTMNLGVALAEMGKRVLLIDFDPQGNLTYCFGLQGSYQKSVADVLLGDAMLEEVLHEAEGLWIAPADVELANAEFTLKNHGARNTRLQQVVEGLPEPFDFILIDCSPSLSLLTVNALVLAQRIVVPLQPEVLSLQGLTMVLDTIFDIKESLNSHLQIVGVLPVMVDKRRNVTFEVLDHLRQHYGIPLFENHIITDVKAVEAPSFGCSVLTYASDSPSAAGYRAFAKELLEKL